MSNQDTGIDPLLIVTASPQSTSADYEQFLIAVEAEENRIIDAEGIWHVNTIYYASSEDASIHRTWEAERRVNERARSMDRYLAKGRRAS